MTQKTYQDLTPGQQARFRQMREGGVARERALELAADDPWSGPPQVKEGLEETIEEWEGRRARNRELEKTVKRAIGIAVRVVAARRAAVQREELRIAAEQAALPAWAGLIVPRK